MSRKKPVLEMSGAHSPAPGVPITTRAGFPAPPSGQAGDGLLPTPPPQHRADAGLSWGDRGPGLAASVPRRVPSAGPVPSTPGSVLRGTRGKSRRSAPVTGTACQRGAGNTTIQYVQRGNQTRNTHCINRGIYQFMLILSG